MNLELRNNEALENLVGLRGVRAVGGTLRVQQMTSLVDLSDLSTLERVGGALLIDYNGNLVDVSLPNLESVGELLVTRNEKLPQCKAQELATRLGVSCNCSDNSNACP